MNLDPADPRERRRFDAAWRFRRHDPADDNDIRAHLTHAKLRPWLLATGSDLAVGEPTPVLPAGEPAPLPAFAAPEFDDTSWRQLDLPHDWAIEGPFLPDLPGDTGKRPWQGVGWYRKSFVLGVDETHGRRVELEFDGAMSHAAVWVNGRFAGGWVYGYTSFRIDLTPHLAADGRNVVAVRLDNPPDSSRWYPGAGLYRHVWLSLTPHLRIAPWGVFVSTPEVNADRALVQVDVDLEHHADRPEAVTLQTTLHAINAADQVVGTVLAQSAPLDVAFDPRQGRRLRRTLTLALPHPRRWSPSSPHRYAAVTTLMTGATTKDRVVTPFGVRTVRCDAGAGLLLNGETVPLRGVCQHHDLGALGAAVNTRALERQLEILQAMGCNALRTAHNPPTPKLLELCDRRGVMVMVEAFDCWRLGKRHHDYGQYFDDWHERDLRAMVRRDRNHPSVILWSIGNEILEQHRHDGWLLAARLAGLVREEDRTRPITAGFNVEASGQTGYLTAVDAIGFNYKPWAYAALRALHPQVPVYGSETSSCVSSRGEYFFPVSDDKAAGMEAYQVSSYDMSAPPWAWPPDREFAGLDDTPGAAGEFVWTGFDYLGEPTPYNPDRSSLLNLSDPAERARIAAMLGRLGGPDTPSRSSYFGIVDLAGFPKDRYYLYQARWRPDLPLAHLLPHWNWPERMGQVTPVHLYTSGDEAELWLNGRSLGRRRRGPRDYRLRWDDVVYEPGTLRVVVWRCGQPWAEATQTTTGPAAALLACADRTELHAGGDDLAFVTVRVVDAEGRLVPRSAPVLRFAVSGAGQLAAVDNGDATSHAPFQGETLPAFNGLALAIVRSGTVAGDIHLTITTPDLTPARLTLRSQPPSP